MGWSWELEPDRIWSRGSLEVSLCDWRRFATAGANKVLQIPASNGNDAQRVEAIEQERMASGLRDHTWMDGVEVRVRLVHSSTTGHASNQLTEQWSEDNRESAGHQQLQTSGGRQTLERHIAGYDEGPEYRAEGLVEAKPKEYGNHDVERAGHRQQDTAEAHAQNANDKERAIAPTEEARDQWDQKADNQIEEAQQRHGKCCLILTEAQVGQNVWRQNGKVDLHEVDQCDSHGQVDVRDVCEQIQIEEDDDLLVERQLLASLLLLLILQLLLLLGRQLERWLQWQLLLAKILVVVLLGIIVVIVLLLLDAVANRNATLLATT